jgi:hypothetical protein
MGEKMNLMPTQKEELPGQERQEQKVEMTQEEYQIKNQRDFIVKQILDGATEVVCSLPLYEENALIDGYRVTQTGKWNGREVRVEKISS